MPLKFPGLKLPRLTDWRPPFGLILAGFTTIQTVLAFPEPVKIRVRVEKSVSRVDIRGFDLAFRRIFQKKRPETALRRDRLSAWQIQCANGKIFATEKSLGFKKLTLLTRILPSPLLVQSPGFIHINGKSYRQDLRIYARNNECEVMNDLDVEKYLDGLVNAEFSAQWNEEAIQAQVVAARTYAYYQSLSSHQNPESYFDLDATSRDQVYPGSEREDFRASRAADKTRGLILARTDLKASPVPIKAFYHSTCGGMTEVPQNVWGRQIPGFRKPVRCPYCSDSPSMHWTLDLKTDELEDILRRELSFSLPKGKAQPRLKRLENERIVELRPLIKNRSGRVTWVHSVWRAPHSGQIKPDKKGSTHPGSKDKVIRFQAVKLRDWLGPARFKSTQFQVEWKSNPLASTGFWHFSGTGNGHGVGMCQWGAKRMGEKRYSMAEILKHYYPNTVLRKVW